MERTLDDIWLEDADLAQADENALRRGRKSYRMAIVGVGGLSCVLDSIFLILFWLSGTVPGYIPLIYAGAGLVYVALFMLLHWTGVSERAKDPQLVVPQMVYCIALQLTMVAIAPRIQAFFLGLIFIIFAFGTLRLRLREALSIWLLTCLAIALVMYFFRAEIIAPIHAQSPLFVLAVWISFSFILLRCLLLGYYGNRLRMRMFQLNTELQQRMLSAEEMAVRDELTGALNRRALVPLADEYLQLTRRKNTACTLVLIDIDHFKAINDSFGHLVGDRVLRHLVLFINRCVRLSDKVGRLGGEEFMMLMPSTSLVEGVEVAERLRAETEVIDWDPIAPGLKLTISIGMTELCAQDTFETVMARADKCLYQAKHTGRNRLIWVAAPG